MYVREIEKPNGSIQIVIVESFRDGEKVRQRTVRNLGTHKDPAQLEFMRKAAADLIPLIQDERTPLLPCFSPAEFFEVKKKAQSKREHQSLSIPDLAEESRISHGINDVFGALLAEFKLNNLNGNQPKEVSRTRESSYLNILNHCILERVRDPVSKRKTALNLAQNGQENIPVHKIYRMMDWLSKYEDAVKKNILNATLNLLNHKVDVLLFDVTTLYFESFDEDELRQFGFSKDCKFKETQVVLALVTTKEGLPITYELLPGKTSEAKTLIQIVANLKTRFNVEDLLIVADRAMFSNDNLQYLEGLGVNYIVAAKLKVLKKEFKDAVISSENRIAVNEQSRDWYKELEHNNRRVIVTYSETRANKDKKDRDRLRERLEKMIKKDSSQVKVSSLITNRGTKKYLKIEDAGRATLNEEKFENDSKWDGIHGVITNKRGATVTEVLNNYKALWRIEEAFRVNKNDLRMRPIFHWKPNRIKAHILICFLAYALSSGLRYRLKENGLNISFEKIRDELKRVQSSIIKNKKTNARVLLPSKTTELQRAIYKTVKLELNEKVTALPNL